LPGESGVAALRADPGRGTGSGPRLGSDRPDVCYRDPGLSLAADGHLDTGRRAAAIPPPDARLPAAPRGDDGAVRGYGGSVRPSPEGLLSCRPWPRYAGAVITTVTAVANRCRTRQLHPMATRPSGSADVSESARSHAYAP